MPAPLRISTVIPLGPGTADLERFADLCAAFAAFAPDLGPIYVINDGGDAAALTALLARYRLAGEVFPHPRANLGNPWLGRLTYGIAHTFLRVHALHPEHLILKLDGDALLVRPLLPQLQAILAANPEAGIIGTSDPVGLALPRHSWRKSARLVRRLTRPLDRADTFPWLQQQLVGPRAAMRRLLHRAAAQGYRWGYHIQGGAYLLTPAALRRLAATPEYRDEAMLTYDHWFGEDLYTTVCVIASGLKVVEQNHPGNLIGATWRGLPGADFAAVLARNHALLHSTKDYPPFNEAEIRAHFRALRPPVPATP
jgi:hypothetical protein